MSTQESTNDIADNFYDEDDVETDTVEVDETDDTEPEDDIEQQADDEAAEPEDSQPDNDDQATQDGTTGRMVPLTALQESRQANRELKEQLNSLTETVNDLKKPAPAPSSVSEDVADLTDGEPDDEDFLTHGQLKAQQKQQAQEVLSKRLVESERSAVDTIIEETHGKGLDFNTVIELGQENLSEKDRQDCLRSKDPATEMYRRCVQRTPELLDAQREHKASKEKQNRSKKQVAASTETDVDDLEQSENTDLVDMLFG